MTIKNEAHTEFNTADHGKDVVKDQRLLSLL